MYFRTPKEAAIWSAGLGIALIIIVLYSYFTRWTPESLVTEEVKVLKAGFEKFPIRSTHYYEYAVYSDRERFFLRDPDGIKLAKEVPYLLEGDMAKISHNGNIESNRGYRIIHIEKDGRLRYSLQRSEYQRNMGMWFSGCAAIVFLFISAFCYAFNLKNET